MKRIFLRVKFLVFLAFILPYSRLIRPYVDAILKVLIPKLRGVDQNPMVVASVLRAIGDLAEVTKLFIYLLALH